MLENARNSLSEILCTPLYLRKYKYKQKEVLHMKRALFFAVLIMFTGMLCANGDPGLIRTYSSADAPLTAGDIIEQVYSRLSRLEKTTIPMLDTDTADEVSQIMDEVHALLEMLPKETKIGGGKPGQKDDGSASNGTNPRLKPRLSPVPDRYPITDKDFENLCLMMENEPYRKVKLTILESVAVTNRFSVEQIVRLLGDYLVFPGDRISALTSIYPACIDPENSYLILELFSSEANQDRAAEIMREN